MFFCFLCVQFVVPPDQVTFYPSLIMVMPPADGDSSNITLSGKTASANKSARKYVVGYAKGDVTPLLNKALRIKEIFLRSGSVLEQANQIIFVFLCYCMFLWGQTRLILPNLRPSLR
jgi:hypothetical protein